ncbi:right-handed parallel beta-helix repeat-containing protein [Candidatus Peregrinibacteria bacterium]|nr:MAG: right-handed parallel beta-helix repeat-containing protein [Candidatus Peregrinibacteria bacterium]
MLDGFGSNINIAGRNPTLSTGNGKSERITLAYSEILNGQDQGWLGGCDDCVIEYNYFKNNGWNPKRGGIFSHSIYVSGGTSSAPVKNIVVRGNTLLQTVDVPANPGGCEGVVIVGHGNQDGLLIEGNVIQEAPGTAHQPCWGIAVNRGYSTPESFKNITIRNNQIEYVGNQVIVTETDCANCLIENNSILYNTSYGN